MMKGRSRKMMGKRRAGREQMTSKWEEGFFQSSFLYFPDLSSNTLFPQLCITFLPFFFNLFIPWNLSVQYNFSCHRLPFLPSFPHQLNDSGGLDLIITPGLAFTKSGQRLGSGKGYYDNFFRCLAQRQHSSSFYSIGIAFRQQILEAIPTESHDIPVDEVITSDDWRMSSKPLVYCWWKCQLQHEELFYFHLMDIDDHRNHQTV